MCALDHLYREEKISSSLSCVHSRTPPCPVSSTVAPSPSGVFHSHPPFLLCVSFVPTIQVEDRPVSSVPGWELQTSSPLRTTQLLCIRDGSQGPVHLLPFTGCLLSSVFLFLQGVLHTPSDMVYQQSMCLLQPWKL